MSPHDVPPADRRGPAGGEQSQVRSTPLVPPLHRSVTYHLDDQTYADIERGGLSEYWYSRYANPTNDLVATEIARLEGAERGYLTASGMAAISTALLTLLGAGDRLVAARQLYGDTRDLLVDDLARWGIEVVFVDVRDLAAWAAAISEKPTAAVYVETFANPTLLPANLPAIAALAHEAGALLLVDNTFATPYVVQPLSMGADVVLHSATKFLNGHSDVTAGVVLGGSAIVHRVHRQLIRLGGCLDPGAAAALWRGLQTFEIRMERATSTAASLAMALRERADICRVIHPSVPGFEDADVAARISITGRFPALVAIVLQGGDERASAVLRELTVACEATSLGDVRTLVSTPFNSSHLGFSPAELRLAGIDPGTIRISCGLEPAAALVADVARAMDAVPAA
jgi:cystathionine beta-lyase/cystathionine gamma-synthase